LKLNLSIQRQQEQQKEKEEIGIEIRYLSQAIDLRSKFSKYWNIPIEQLKCGVFTTDSKLVDRSCAINVVTESIPVCTLEQWQQNYKNG